MTIATVGAEQNSRDRILDAAEALFARRGYARVGLREVAEQVGLGKSSLFHHFRNKPELYAAVAARILRRMEQSLQASIAAGGPPLQRLDRLLDGLIDLLATHPSYSRVLLRSLFEDDDLAGGTAQEIDAHRAIGSIMGSMADLVREGIAAGHFRRVNVHHLLLTLVGLVVFPFASRGFGREVLGHDVFDPAEVVRRKQEVRELLRHGLLAAQAGSVPG